jgi:hypothetical protein
MEQILMLVQIFANSHISWHLPQSDETMQWQYRQSRDVSKRFSIIINMPNR